MLPRQLLHTHSTNYTHTCTNWLKGCDNYKLKLIIVFCTNAEIALLNLEIQRTSCWLRPSLRLPRIMNIYVLDIAQFFATLQLRIYYRDSGTGWGTPSQYLAYYLILFQPGGREGRFCPPFTTSTPKFFICGHHYHTSTIGYRAPVMILILLIDYLSFILFFFLIFQN